jgi:hypothetical protein
MESYRWTFHDDVFVERFEELSDKQIREYLRLRKANILAGQLGRPGIDALRGPRERVIPLEEAGLVADVEMLCELGFVSREFVAFREA